MENSHIDPHAYRPSKGRLVLTFGVAVIVVSVLVVVGVVPRLHSAASAEADRDRLAAEPAHVDVAPPRREVSNGKLILPGAMQGLQEAVVNARANGYVHAYNVDIGDRVKKDQVIATLDTPDIDEELRAAEAAALQAKANVEAARTQAELAQTENTRYQVLAGSGVVSTQDMEEHKASYDARSAGLRAAEAAEHTADANVGRLRDEKQFATIVAPFDGVITQRNIEIGQLVSSGTGQAMFRVANTATVRVFVNVPQVDAPSIKVGDTAAVSLREFPDRAFTGHVTRTAGALDPGTRTLLTQVDIPNPDGALLPGMYAQIGLAVNRTDSPLMIPPSALIYDADGTRVCLVASGKIHWQKVGIDANMGDEVAILTGLHDSDQVVLAPSERLVEGMAVTAEAPKPKKDPTKAAASPPAPAAPAAPAAPTTEEARPAPLPATTPLKP